MSSSNRQGLSSHFSSILVEENAHKVISLGIGLWEFSRAAEHHLPENTLLLIKEMRDTMGLSGP